ncbi:MAG: hybrid sensor histidine kinase/response regulator [Acidobacteria bacterium]|nr:hybrid sensor histidine kinase/response regulator [Acidobacteriota bacterium]
MLTEVPFSDSAISDQGSGIPEDEVSRVLDKFFRGRGAPGGGSGLGLAIVQRIVHRHGGRVNKKILIVEDDTAMVRMLRDNLVYEGFVVETATDGSEALRQARVFAPDLVLLDLMLPSLARSDVDHHPHRAHRQGRQGEGTRAGRRRLRDQALRARRTAGAGSRRVATDPTTRGAGGARGPADRLSAEFGAAEAHPRPADRPRIRTAPLSGGSGGQSHHSRRNPAVGVGISRILAHADGRQFRREAAAKN